MTSNPWIGRTILLALALSAGAVQQAVAQAKPDASRMAAATQLLKAMGMDTGYFAGNQDAGDELLAQLPNAAEMRGVVKEFTNKYLPASKLQAEMTRLYANAFTTDELHRLTAFYRTPLGQKAARVQPKISADFARFTQAELMKHMPELQQMLMQRMMK